LRLQHAVYLTAKAVPTQIKHFGVLQAQWHFCFKHLS